MPAVLQLEQSIGRKGRGGWIGLGEWILFGGIGLLLLFWVIRTALNTSQMNANMIAIGETLSKLAKQQRDDMAAVHKQLSEVQDQLYELTKGRDR